MGQIRRNGGVADAISVHLYQGDPGGQQEAGEAFFLTGTGGPLAASDYLIRSVAPNSIRVPLAGCRRVTLHYRTLTNFDQAGAWQVYGGSVSGATNNALLAAATIPAATALLWTAGEGAPSAVGGAAAGTATIASGAHYNVPALNAGWEYLFLRHIFGVAPGAGEIEIYVVRSW